MGEHIFRVLLEELRTVRVRCKTCNGVTEVPLENLEAVFEHSKCPCCDSDIGGGVQDAKDRRNRFANLAKGIEGVRDLAEKCSIEFALRLDKAGEPPA